MSICTSVWQPLSQRGIPRVTTCVKLDGDQDLTLWLRSLEDVLRELLGDDIHTYDRHMIDLSQNGKWYIPEWKWHIPNWKVAYTRMESGISQNGKWHIPEWKVVYAKMNCGVVK